MFTNAKVHFLFYRSFCKFVLMIKTEQDYINALLQGDMKGLDLIYSKFLPSVTRFIMTKGGNAEDAQDIFQDALLILFEKTRKGDFQIEKKFYSYLMVICRNLWGNRLQRKSFREVTLPEQVKLKADDDILSLILKEEEEKLFWSAFEKLGKDCQKILKLFFQKVKMEKIKEVMGFGSVGYTKKRKHQCKGKLVEFVKADSSFNELSF